MTKSGTVKLMSGFPANDTTTPVRWMTAREKLAASGLAVTQDMATVAGLTSPVDWQMPAGWHQRVGNGNFLPNLGMVKMAIGLSLIPTDAL